MYEAPDRYKRMISARLPGGESLGLASARDRRRKLAAARRPADFARPARAVLRRRQHRRRADDGRQPVGLERAAALAAAAGPARSAVVNFGAMQLARTQAITHVGRSGRRVPELADGRRSRRSRRASGSACRSICSRRSTRAARSSPPRSWPVSASPRSAWSSSRPASPPGWSLSPPASAASLLIGRHSVPFQHMLSILFTLGVAIFGVLDRRALGVPPTEDQRRRRRAERKRQPAPPGI